MKIILIGNTGQLGFELERTLSTLGSVLAYDTPLIDLVQPESTLELIRQARPDVIVNATAYTAVDQAESRQDLAQAINAQGPGLLADVARQLNAALIHYSTDYVFDGTKGSPYRETDAPHPLNVYGQSKLAGEQAIQQVGGAYLIFRTSWVYSLRRDSFVTKVLQWARQYETLRLVTDQVGNPTWCRALAEATAQLLAQAQKNPSGWIAERRGVYHLAGSGHASRLAWGESILEAATNIDALRSEQLGLRAQEILPALTVDFPTPAQRPLFSALDCSLFTETFGLQLPPWETALRLALQE